MLETGEFIKVGASKVIKTDVRIIAATNENIEQAIANGKFREDLFYRLSTVPISLPPLRNRGGDIHLLFRKFASDFAEKYRMPAIKLTVDSVQLLNEYNWPGNIRQLRNLVEQISVIGTEREISAAELIYYLPEKNANSPALIKSGSESVNERELMYKFLFDMKKDLNDLKKLVIGLIPDNGEVEIDKTQEQMISRFANDIQTPPSSRLLPMSPNKETFSHPKTDEDNYEVHKEIEESLSLEDREKELIQKALVKHKGKRKYAAAELGISERTLYRKIKEYNLAD